MKKRRIFSIIMLVVLAIGIACMAYGVTGRNIYNNAVVMMGSDKKTAMSFIQDPEKLTELGNLSKIGADNVKRFLKGFDLDAAAVDKAVDERAAFETAQANAKDRDKFFAYAQSVDETVTEDNFNDLIKDHSRSDPMRKAMAMEELGVDEAAYDTLAANETLLEMYRANLPKLLENNHMTNAVQIQFIGLVLVTVAFAYFIIQAMDIKPRPRTRAENPKVTKITSFFLNYALFIIMGLILVVVSIIRIDFLSMNNILNILQNASTKGILALGCAGLIVLAGTDLSIGRVLGISAAVTASLVQSTTYASRMYPTMVSSLGSFGLLIPLFASIAVAVVFGMVNGFGVAKLHLHAFIVTLGTQLIAYGVNCLYIESQPSGTAQALSTFDPKFLNIAAGAFYIGGVRVPLVVVYFIVLATIIWIIWNKTKLGKNMFAVGGNTEAAAVSGVNVAKTIMLVYLMAGVLYGIASFLEAARITSVGANTGLNYETDAISACVVGGVSFSGGVGTIQGVVIGAVILQAIVYALQFLGVNPYIQYIIRGLIIILAVSIDVRKYIVKK
jgi:ABC-type glucose/galactose transport system, permease component